jgi:hypothetical protein
MKLTEPTILETNFEILAPLPSSDRGEVNFESRASALHRDLLNDAIGRSLSFVTGNFEWGPNCDDHGFEWGASELCQLLSPNLDRRPTEGVKQGEKASENREKPRGRRKESEVETAAEDGYEMNFLKRPLGELTDQRGSVCYLVGRPAISIHSR